MSDNRVQRRLAAVLAADVAGYSRLMRLDEEATMAAWWSYRREIVDPLVVAHGGRVVKLTGDGFLAEFSSATDAVSAAIAMQAEIASRVAGVAEDRRVLFRMGVNLGDILWDDEDIYGDGVNVAARIGGLSEPGGIVVSASVHDQVQRRVQASFEDLGEQELKNIDAPVKVYRVTTRSDEPAGSTAAAGLSPAPPSRDHPFRQERPAIAVLPFENMSNDPEQDYFADGITEDIITALTHWRSFPVIARNSSFAYKGKPVDIEQAGRDLGARYLLEGSVRKGSARVRITAQLIDGANGHHLWAEKYDRDLDDVFAVQDDIVQRIVAVVAPEVARAELERATRKQPQDYDAWDLCLRGMAAIREMTAEGNARAREFFTRALAIRPDYADAYGGLARSLNLDILFGAAQDRIETATRAMEAARKAIACDESSSWAHEMLSTAYQWLDRPEDALAEARIAVELNPYDAFGLHALGNKADLAGDPNGIAYMEKAQALNPQDAQLHTHLTFLARAYVNAGDHRAAADRARRAIRRRPDYAPAQYILAIALGHLGELDAARDALAKCEECSPGFVQSRRNWQPYADAAGNERLRQGMRRIEG